MFPIREVTDLDIAFGGQRLHLLMPAMADIPKDYPDKSKWTEFFHRVFFKGAKGVTLLPQEGVDKSKALRHLRAVMMSMEPKHEHKEAACAWLLSQWFTGWEEGPEKPKPAETMTDEDEQEWKDWYERKLQGVTTIRKAGDQ